ncbi:helix-turn-helix domain-containing protein [Phaeobacter gallaeciensis]|uniref:helix-turn-helix domain-containing protein n=1 Tax=Phaeobacter gallaeciensis TaxID=60890 RepID=UPI0003D6B7BA|nr:helix-turn-helix domain-containing protein [Phaeobacter gallaeciensis]AHD12162.1 helix-turn-helix protein [Phaeobacter gallaeciensis DSM 26640]ATE95346.1 helix-turn-helix protein [Phaeobacter gallaeciensis]
MTAYRQQIDKYCKLRGISRPKAGLEAGYNKNYVADLVNGKITPTIEALEAIAHVLSVPLSVLLFGEEVDPQLAEFTDKFQRLDAAGQHAVGSLIETLSSLPEKK